MMKIEQYHHDAIDQESYDWLQDMTGSVTRPIDDRLVAIYWTYKAMRDALNSSDRVSWNEWRFLCILLGLYKREDRLDVDLEQYLRSITGCQEQELDPELTQNALAEAAFYDATKGAESRAVRRLEYLAAVGGHIPVPEHVKPGLLEKRERWLDVKKSQRRAKAKVKTTKGKPTDNGKALVIEAADFERFNERLTIDYKGVKTGKFTKRWGPKLIFVEDVTGNTFRIPTVRLRE
jgi:hypothetical protein